MERHLSAVFAADMVAYSRLMETDEAGTIKRQKAHRAEIIDPAIARYRGRVVRVIGDGILADFVSVVDAVQCALTIQKAVAKRQAGIAEDRRILYRIGINLGDIIIDEDDIYGDGVNIAARLEAMADPGGICISGTAYDQLKAKIEVGYEDLGLAQVKNISEPVRIYRVLADAEQAGLMASPPGLWGKVWRLAIAASILVAVGLGAAWWQAQPDFQPADPAKFTYKLPDKPSIAVLPFDNLTGDPGQDYLSDGLSENIIAVLATAPDLFVIARNSSFIYKGKATKVQEVAENLGVRYLLEGSIQTSGGRIRATAQLIDALDGTHLWAERYDRPLEDFFRIQDEIAQKILVALHSNLTIGSTATGVAASFDKDLEAYRQFVEAFKGFETMSRNGNRDSENLLTSLKLRAPDSAYVHIMLGYVQWQKVQFGWTENAPAYLREARNHAENGLALSVDKSLASPAFGLMATLDLMELKYDSAIENADRALETAPSTAQEIAIAGWVKGASGQPAEGIKILKQVMRTEPTHAPWLPTALHSFLMMLDRFDEAKVFAQGVLSSTSNDVNAHAAALSRLAAIAVIEDDLPAARQYVKRLIELRPDWSVSRLAEQNYYLRDKAYLKRYLGALRTAGLPEIAPT